MTRRLGHPSRPPVNSTIALINVVFLMLIFFLIAGSLAPQPDADLSLVNLDDITTQPPSDALLILADGSLRLDGRVVSSDEAIVGLRGIETVRLMPDRESPASALLGIVRALQSAGIDSVALVVEPRAP